jgi:hypothetical protein
VALGRGCAKTHLKLKNLALRHDFRKSQSTKILISLRSKFLRSDHELNHRRLLAFLHSLFYTASANRVSSIPLPVCLINAQMRKFKLSHYHFVEAVLIAN